MPYPGSDGEHGRAASKGEKGLVLSESFLWSYVGDGREGRNWRPGGGKKLEARELGGERVHWKRTSPDLGMWVWDRENEKEDRVRD